MSQSVYWILVLKKECIEFYLNSFSNHFHCTILSFYLGLCLHIFFTARDYQVSKLYTATGTSTRVVRNHWVGAYRETGKPHLCISFSEMSKQRKGRGKDKDWIIHNIAANNVSACSTNVEKRGEIWKMFLNRFLDVRALTKTELKGKMRWLCSVRWLAWYLSLIQ